MLALITHLNFHETYLIENQSSHTCVSEIKKSSNGNFYLVNCDRSVTIAWLKNLDKKASYYLQRCNSC